MIILTTTRAPFRLRRPPTRLIAAAVTTAVAGTAALFLLPMQQASATAGPAPEPREYRVLQDIHTDAISTFLDDGALALGTKADVPEGNGVRFAADEVWFHIDAHSAQTLPAGFEFIAEASSQVWIAPESNPGGDQLWPGFSTESVPSGAIDGNETRFTLTDFTGPGDLELFRTGAFGTPTRLWSSDEEHKDFTVGRTHMHANWAFTAAGIYRLTVTAAVAVGAVPMTDTATYTFVVGDPPTAVATTTSVEVSATALTAGEAVTVTGTVTPPRVEGYLEFRDGTTVLGHAPVESGRAALTVADLSIGAHSITASFVPAVRNLAAGSTSPPVAVTVTDESGVEFAIAGIVESYRPGDVLRAHVVGAVLGTGQNFQWAIRPVGATSSGYAFTGTGGQASQGVVEQRLDASHDGYEMRVRLRTGTTVVSTSDWTPIRVVGEAQPPSLRFAAGGPLYLGDEVLLEVTGPQLATGESLQFVQRFSSPWSALPNVEQVDATRFRVSPAYSNTSGEWGVQVISDGLAVAQSAPVPVDIRNREILVEGIQSVYRAGQTLRATGTVHPAKEGLLYRWILVDLATYQTSVVKEGTDAAAMSIELPVTLDHDNHQLTFAALWDYGPVQAYAGQRGTRLNVSDADPSTQLFFFSSLGDHYHQGSPINLQLIADPALADDDVISWQWRWPGTDEWTSIPEAAGLAHSVIAEQALAGVEVRASLTFGSGDVPPMVAEPVIIHIDDHGAAPRQQVTVGGRTAYVASETATLTAQVSPTSLLTRYQWFEKPAGATEATPIPGANDREYSFTASTGHDGREISVALLLPGGQIAYGPSTPVTLTVRADDDPQPALRITGLAERYQPGELVTLSAVQDPGTDFDHYHWFIRAVADGEWAVVPGASSVPTGSPRPRSTTGPRSWSASTTTTMAWSPSRHRSFWPSTTPAHRSAPARRSSPQCPRAPW
jgi:surface-anchored protein